MGHSQICPNSREDNLAKRIEKTFWKYFNVYQVDIYLDDEQIRKVAEDSRRKDIGIYGICSISSNRCYNTNIITSDTSKCA